MRWSLVTNNYCAEKARVKLMPVEERDRVRAAEAVVDAAIWCQLLKGPVSINDSDREFLVNIIKANPQFTGSLFKNGILNLS